MATTTTVARPASGLLATNETRVDGAERVSGKTRYTADIKRPQMLWAAFATSPHAHAKIRAIDTTAAKAVPGVRAVLTGEDIGRRRFGRQLVDWPVLCWDTVLMIGDRVAAVAAETREAAEEAARLVAVTYEELPAVLDPAAALAPGAPVLHPDRMAYIWTVHEGKEKPALPHPNLQGWNSFKKGADDLAPLFAGAYRTYVHTFRTPRQHAGYIEPRATLVWIDDDGTVHVQSPNKTPFPLRGWLARCWGIAREKIVIEASEIGGDFGGKGMVVDESPCYFLAQATGRPVRYVERYSEELGTAPTRHAGTITLRSAVDANGKFVAHESEVIYNGGAYAGGKPGPKVMPGSGYSTVPYHIPNARIATKAVYTNTLPAAHVRAPNDLQIFFAWEQHVDMIARDLGIDPLAFRIANVLRDGETAITNEAMRAMSGVEVLETLRREAHYDAPLPPGRGRGISLVCRHTGASKTALQMRAHADGTIEIVSALVEQGGGQLTVAQRVTAATMDVRPGRVAIRRRGTDAAMLDPGTGGSRVTHTLGRCSQIGGEKLKAALEERSGMTLRDDAFVDAAGSVHPFATVTAQICAAGPIEIVAEYDGIHGADHPGDYTFTAFGIEVDVDRETGTVRVTDAVIVTDVGEIINPIAHQGQIDGGFAAGIGSSLMEEITIDESGKVETLSLGEYKLPTIADMPLLRTVLVHANLGEGPFGAKMAGELSNTGVAPAIANAIHSAAGIRLHEFPLTAERVYHALHGS